MNGKENDTQEEAPELGELAARYLEDVSQAIDATPEGDQRRPFILALKLGFVGVAALVEIGNAIVEATEPAGDDPE